MILPRLDFQIAVESSLWSGDFCLRNLCEEIFAKSISILIFEGYLIEGNTVEVSIVFTDSKRIKDLNFQYLGVNKPTNVLSFPVVSTLSDGYSRLMLGDIVLAYEIIELEASVLGKKLKDHLVHLIIHGFLHLLGYDHVDDEDAFLMEGLERSILESLGIDDPYEMD
ncbi:rRNA maturation RNase YbeY [Candidatus Liberibacter brunswickensis]